MPTPQNRPVGKLTIKEQRAQKRAAQIEAFKKKEAASRRNRLLGIIGGIVALIFVAGGVTAALYFGTQEQAANVPPIEEPIAEQTVDPSELEGTTRTAFGSTPRSRRTTRRKRSRTTRSRLSEATTTVRG